MPSQHEGPVPPGGAHLTTAVALRSTLEFMGVEFLFGMDAPAALHATLGGSSITPITVRDERSAAFMADGYAKVRRRPGVVGVGGVGATNAIQGTVESSLGSTPVVLLVEEGSAATRHRNDLQDIDRIPMFASITRWAGQVEHADRVVDLTERAFRIATTGRAGPVYLGCPWDVVSKDATTDVVPSAGLVEYPAARVSPDPAATERVAAMLRAAERPAIVAGGGLVASGATGELATLAHALGAPVATTPSGKGAFDEFDPLSAGVVGSYTGGVGGHGRAANELIRSADLVLLVGTATGSGATANWTVPDHSQALVHLDVDPREPRRNYRASFPLVGDAKLGLDALCSAIGDRVGTRWAGDAPAPREPCRTEPAGAIDPCTIVGEIQGRVDDDTVVVADAGYCAAWALDVVRFRAAGRRFLAPSAYGTFGYGLPASIGAKVAAPWSTVVCITGDGGMAFSLAELETAARCGIAVTVVVLNNSALGWSRQYDRHFYAYEGKTEFTDVDYAAVARGSAVRERGW